MFEKIKQISTFWTAVIILASVLGIGWRVNSHFEENYARAESIREVVESIQTTNNARMDQIRYDFLKSEVKDLKRRCKGREMTLDELEDLQDWNAEIKILLEKLKAN